jgi:hypothetical protein
MKIKINKIIKSALLLPCSSENFPQYPAESARDIKKLIVITPT